LNWCGGKCNALRTRHARQPQRNPQKARCAKRDEIRPPAVALHQRAPKQQSKRGAHANAHVDECVGEAAMARGKVMHNDAGETRVCGGFADAQQQAEKKERGKSAREAVKNVEADQTAKPMARA